MSRRRDRAVVDELIAAGVTPGKLKGSEGISLIQGKRKVRLVADDGTVTKQGRYWEQRTGEQLPAGGFMQQAAVREGNVSSSGSATGARA